MRWEPYVCGVRRKKRCNLYVYMCVQTHVGMHHITSCLWLLFYVLLFAFAAYRILVYVYDVSGLLDAKHDVTAYGAVSV